MVAAPDVELGYGLSHASYTLAVFAVPLLLSALLEAVLALFIDRVSRVRFLAWSLLGLAASLVLAAWAPSVAWLTGALALSGAASGAACGAAQAELIRLDDPERALTRWTFYGAVGDVTTPLMLAAVVGAGGSYRTLLGVVALFVAVQALRFARATVSPTPLAASEHEAEEAPPLREALARCARNGWLWAWLFGVACCSLLDELVCALFALRFEQELAAGPAVLALALTAISLGAVVGAAVTERLLVAQASARILVGSAGLSLGALLVATHTESLVVALAALPVLGAASAAHYPLLMARAYAEVPHAPGLANAIAQVFVVLDIGAPLLIGFIADRFGLGVALTCLGLQPVVVVVLTLLGGGRAPSVEKR